MGAAGSDQPSARLSSYQKKLFVFLSVATFFEGYDFLALTQILPNLRADMALSKADAGWLVAFINLGTVVAYLVIQQADKWGRRTVLTVTIAGYTIFTFATAWSWDVYSFAVFQFLARIFLIAEWATAMVYAAEEFPARRRGMVIGVISAFSSLGAIVCAGVVPLLLEVPLDSPVDGEPMGWRMIYLVGIIPLILIAFARRNLRETERFQVASSAGRTRRPFFHIFATPYWKRMLQLAAIWGITYVCAQNAVTFFKDYAATDRGLTDAEIGGMITIAALISMPLVFAVGPMLDVIGRKKGAVIVFLLGGAGVFGSYSFGDRTGMTVSLIFAIFGGSAVLPVLNAFTTELFPTEHRADAFAWANNLIGRIGYVLSPILVAQLAETYDWGPVLRLTAIANVIALILIFAMLPETSRKELEETSALT